jgi:hypothetical protein
MREKTKQKCVMFMPIGVCIVHMPVCVYSTVVRARVGIGAGSAVMYITG